MIDGLSGRLSLYLFNLTSNCGGKPSGKMKKMFIVWGRVGFLLSGKYYTIMVPVDPIIFKLSRKKKQLKQTQKKNTL